VGVVSALKAFETTLHAASRHNGVAMYIPLLEQLQQCADSSKHLTSVRLSDNKTGHVSKNLTVSCSCCSLLVCPAGGPHICS
jgi:hypothetical protein